MDALKIIKWICALALTCIPVQAMAEEFDQEYEKKPWAEIEVQLPAFPEKENLIPFRVGALADNKFLIDGNSISVGSDGVIRYTLVVISSAGAQNISYEGLRCDTAGRRFYAFGRSDKTWSKARSNQWVTIQGNSNNQYVELFTNYFCAIGASSIRTAADARRVLRKVEHPSAHER